MEPRRQGFCADIIQWGASNGVSHALHIQRWGLAVKVVGLPADTHAVVMTHLPMANGQWSMVNGEIGRQPSLNLR